MTRPFLFSCIMNRTYNQEFQLSIFSKINMLIHSLVLSWLIDDLGRENRVYLFSRLASHRWKHISPIPSSFRSRAVLFQDSCTWLLIVVISPYRRYPPRKRRWSTACIPTFPTTSRRSSISSTPLRLPSVISILVRSKKMAFDSTAVNGTWCITKRVNNKTWNSDWIDSFFRRAIQRRRNSRRSLERENTRRLQSLRTRSEELR